jgi:hypothetical protein
MIDSLISLLNTLNTASPIAIIGLLGSIIWLLVQNDSKHGATLKKIQTNDLHELPAMAETLRQVAETLRRIEQRMGEEFTFIRTRLDR